MRPAIFLHTGLLCLLLLVPFPSTGKVGANPNRILQLDTLKLKVQSNGLTKYDDGRLRNAYTLLDYNKFGAALESFEEAVVFYRQNEDWLGYLAASNEVVKIFYQTGKFDNGFKIADQLMVEGPERLGPKHPLIGDLFYHYGELLYESRNYPEALRAHQKALEIRLEKDGASSLSVASSFEALGSVYRFGDFDYQKAEEYYFKALEIWEKFLKPESHQLAECYYNLATTYRLKGDFDQGIAYATQASRIYERTPPADIQKLSNAYIAIANNYWSKDNFTKAAEYANQAIYLVSSARGPDADILAYYYNSLGTIYQNMEELGRAVEALNKALEINLKNPELNAANIAGNFVNLALNFEGLGEMDSARYYHNKSLEIFERYLGETHPQTIDALLLLGEHFETQQNYDSALAIYHAALTRAIPEFNAPGVYDLPPIELIVNNSQLSDIFKAKADLLKRIFLLDTTDTQVLEVSLENYLLAQYTIALNRRGFETEGSKLFLAKEQKKVFENSLDCVYWLYDKSGNPDYIHLAFDFMEKSKSILLLESLNNAEAFNLAGIPDSLKKKETDLKINLGELQFQLAREKNQETISDQTVRELEERIFEVSREQDNLKEVLQSSYANYYEIKYNMDTIGFSNMQALLKQKETTLVEFFWGDSAIYSLSISGEHSRLSRIDPNPKFLSELDEFLKEVRTIPEGLEVDPARVKQYANIAYSLYVRLLQPHITPADSVARMLMVSDGPLAEIPFEALLWKEAGSFDDGYHLPYLVLKFPTSYAYSANLYFKSSLAEFTNASLKLLAFSYSEQSAADLKTGSLEILRGMGYDELPGAAKELKAIASLMDGQFYWGEDATETSFKMEAPEYDILHLAIHGEGGQDVVSETRLVFRNKYDTANDGSLYPHELYNMPLKARLVILSACETGLGKYYSGEGMFSIARAFAYSGSPSLISTFWKINDNTTYKLISALYQSLISGETIDQSLRTAKTTYLNNALGNAAHPSNWAALVLFGNTAPLQRPPGWSYLIWIVLGPIAIGVVIWLYGVRKSANRRRYHVDNPPK